MLHIALAKGRVADQVMVFLQEAGITFPEYSVDSRKLIFTDIEDTIKVTLVKSPDVPVYVELGAADVGIVGKNTSLASCETDCRAAKIIQRHAYQRHTNTFAHG